MGMSKHNCNLKELMIEGGITIFDMALEVDKTQATVCRWRNGSCAPDTPEVVIKVCDYLSLRIGRKIDVKDVWVRGGGE